MKTIYAILLFVLCLSTGAWAQKDSRAKEVLDRTVHALEQAGGIRATFSGTSEGTLLVDGQRFYLSGNGVQSWFDGKTQWTYLEKSKEVNISCPTPEELQEINPYALLSLYKSGYNYQYTGAKSRNGKQGYEVVLTPEKKQDITSVTLFVSTAYRPLYIKVEREGMAAAEIQVTSYQDQLRPNDAAFRFDKAKFPGVEVIDLR